MKSTNKKEKQNFKNGIQIFLDTSTNECIIGSTSQNPWIDMAVCLEGLSVICKKCIEKGMTPEKVYGEVFTYFTKAHKDYEIKHELN
jgi:hypothetical protein